MVFHEGCRGARDTPTSIEEAGVTRRRLAPAPSGASRGQALLLAGVLAFALGCSSGAAGGGVEPTAGSLAPPATQTGVFPTASAQGTGPPTGGEGTLSWAPCTRSDLNKYQCASLAVPLDYAHSDQATITLALVRSRATDPSQRIGSLLINPGGPGGSALDEFAFLDGQLSSALRAHFDIVGFDPRGVGASQGVTCLSDPQLDAYYAADIDTSSASGLAQERRLAQTYVNGCEQRSGALLPFVGTIAAARDIDRIRAAVGDPKTSYLGYSYGTFLGSTYAQEFPTRVRAAVLDGAYDATLDPLDAAVQQIAAFQQALDAFVADCQDSSSCLWRPNGDPHAVIRQILTSAGQRPLSTAIKGRVLAQPQALTGMLAPLYDRSTWPVLAASLQQAQSGNGTLLLTVADSYYGRDGSGHYSDLLQANSAINCVDSAYPTDPAPYQAAAERQQRAAPDLAPALGQADLTCALWPVRGTKPAVPTAKGAPPILVVGSTGDPATPYDQAVTLSRQLSSGVLLTREGEGHTGYGSSQCVRDKVDAYLIDGTVPAAGTRCTS